MKRTWSQKNTFHGGQFSLLQQTIAKLPTKAHPVGLFPGGKENVETITHPQAHQCSRRESRRLSFVSSDAASSTTDSPLCLGSLSLHSSKQQKTEYYYYIRIIIIARGSACIMQDTQPGPGRGRGNRLPLACGGRCGWRKANSDPINALTKVIPMPVSGQPRPCLRLSLAISTITRSGRA